MKKAASRRSYEKGRQSELISKRPPVGALIEKGRQSEILSKRPQVRAFMKKAEHRRFSKSPFYFSSACCTEAVGIAHKPPRL